jgi:hypothetical protein
MPREVLRKGSRQDAANRDERDARAMTATDAETQRLCEQIAKLERINAALRAKVHFRHGASTTRMCVARTASKYVDRAGTLRRYESVIVGRRFRDWAKVRNQTLANLPAWVTA